MKHGTYNMEYQKQGGETRVVRYLLPVTSYLFLFLLPLLALALTSTELLNNISSFVINPIIFVLFAAAFLVFIWGLVQFVGNLDNEEARSQGVQHMIWGIVGMVVMVSVNGIIAIIANTVTAIGGG